MKRGILGILIVLLFLMVGSLSVHAEILETRVNVTLLETVYRNISYGQSAVDWGENTTSCTITGVLNITNPSTDITLFEVIVEFTNTANMLTNFSNTDGRTGTQTSATADNYTIEIPELMPGNYSTWSYNVSCLTVAPPVSIDTMYAGLNSGLDRKVLAGENWTVTQNVTNALSILKNISQLKIEIYSNSIFANASNGSTLRNFTLVQLVNPFRGSTNDADNVTGNATNDRNWNWTPGGGTLNTTQEYNISFIVKAPDMTPESGIYLALTERLSYVVEYASSNLTITMIRAKGPGLFRESKKIIQPADDNPNSTNVTWQVDAMFNTSYNISYNLDAVSLWITESLNPGNSTTRFGELNKTYNPDTVINITDQWYTDPSGTFNTSWKFNFTDGSDDNSPPPIVWMRPYFELINSYNQILNSSFTQSGNDYYMKYVYVVNGYWLQVDKNVSNIGEDQYLINITVENIGNAWTPSGLDVTVYDFIPAEFNWSLATFTQQPNRNESVFSGTFNGTAFRWVIPRKVPFNASLGPKTETPINRIWTTEYRVNGTGDYRVSELYIVGLDPRKVDGAGSHEGITVISGFISGTKEMVYLIGLIALIGLNVLNFIMTRRINRRLDK